jgi:hypothetical protein
MLLLRCRRIEVGHYLNLKDHNFFSVHHVRFFTPMRRIFAGARMSQSGIPK